MNNKDICPNVAEPYEAFCTSKSDFNADAPVFYDCLGTDSEACKKAGGMYNPSDDGGSGKCDDIDTSTSNACDIISGFESEVSSTCEEFGSYVLYYSEAAFYKDYSSPYVSQYILPRYQDKCCGGEMNNKNICPNTITPDHCSVCNENDRNIKVSGISNKCYDEGSAWSMLPGNNTSKECEGKENDNLSTVSVECKSSLFSMLNCPINRCEDDYGKKIKYGNDIYSCKQLGRTKKKYRKKICKRKSARKLCTVICKK